MKNFRLNRILLTVLALLLVWSFMVLGSLGIGDGGAVTDTGTAIPVISGIHIVDTYEAEYSYSDMEEDIFLLAGKYPELFRFATAGRSCDGREIYYCIFGQEGAEKQIIVTAGIHGREYINPMLVMNQLEYYLENYYTGEYKGRDYSDIFASYNIIVIPMMNPDGIMLSQEGIESIRSEELREQIRSVYDSDCEKYSGYRNYGSLDNYLKYWKANARGVDLNRNYGIDYWQAMNTKINQPSSQRYKGASPASEPETQAVVALTESLSNPVCTISMHSQGQVIYWDCGQTGELRESTLSLAKTAHRLNRYMLQSEFTNPDATFDDWCVLNRGIPAINIETGTGTCPLPISQYEQIWNENYLVWADAAILFS